MMPSGTFHVPEGIIELIFFVSNNTHAYVRNKIAWRDNQDARKNVYGVGIMLIFKVGFSQQTVGIKVLGKRFENMFAMRDRFIQMTAVDHCLNFAVISSQGYFRHEVICSCIAVCPFLK